MQTCRKCAESVQDQAIVCPHCGFRVRPNYLLGAIVFCVVLFVIYFGASGA